ncbi:alginate lyase family protein [Streptomyces sp. DH24]|uniref:alginate lyase family protein n=1 Tax=Streptomyces sp. DH24 TaxID=3040123 RepID=UPI0024431E6D|nr:alginate lyase family protein [Streptomyces sp. DH24]MDG9719948.1 alginate lyase family protein [Streptomyces sp. DH24]
MKRVGPARRRRRAAALLAVPLAAALVVSCGTGDGRTMARALPADADFTHPGVLVGKDQLTAVRKNVTAGKQPWLKAYLDMRDSKYGSYKYRPEPHETVICPADGRPGHGCAEERADAIAAYTQALLFTVTGKRQHAVKAREILDAWSGRLKGHGIQDAGWAASTWARAAEIVRHTPGADWPAERVRRFEDMLRSVHLPAVGVKVPGRSGGQDLVMTDAAISIAVFLDDHKAFDRALERFRARVPVYFSGKNGVTQDTCRGLREVGRGIAATAHIAETAWHQGVDLYDEVKDRLTAALTLHARRQAGEPVSAASCGGRVGGGGKSGSVGQAGSRMGPGLEVALHHLEDRLGGSVPAAHRLAAGSRPAGTDNLFVAWETLTHVAKPGEKPAG